jgi:hypothetical protein
MKRILVGLFALGPFLLSAQKVAIKKIELAGEKVIVHYDLDDNNPNNQYQISLYASKDKYSAPLTKVTGDVGGEVNPGAGRRIEWNLLQEYGTFKGKLSLEIRGRVFVPFVKLRDFNTAKKYKRGKSYDLAWRPGNTNPIHIELYKGSQKVAGELNHPNNGKSTLSIDSKVKPGKDYRLKITDSKKLDEVVYSDYFTVTPKIPLLLKLIPALGVAGGLAVVVSSLGGGGDGNETEKKDPISDPPFPSGN